MIAKCLRWSNSFRALQIEIQTAHAKFKPRWIQSFD